MRREKHSENFQIMENYVKKESTLEASEKSKEPIHSLTMDSNAINMNVKAGSKVANLMNFAQKKFENDEIKQITWNGSGEGISKAIACAEIMKKRFKDLYQINKIGYSKTEEIWTPKLESLRNIKVTKEIPTICIILSKTPLDSNEIGFQTDKTIEELFKSNSQQQNKSKGNKNILNTNSDEIYVKKKKLNNPNKK